MQGYAWEITTAEGGWGLDTVLQSRQHILNGITNGIDLDEWDPEADEHTVASYSANDLTGKAASKEALQKELGLEVNPDVSLPAAERLLPSSHCRWPLMAAVIHFAKLRFLQSAMCYTSRSERVACQEALQIELRLAC